MINRVIKYCLIVLLLSGNVSAQNISFTATANNTTVAAGEQFQVTYSVNGSGTRFQAAPLRDFSVLMGPSQSMSTQIVNGSFSQSISYTYVLVAQKEGTFEIGSASVEVDGKKYQSNPLKITVAKGNQHPKAQGNNQSNDASSSSGLDSKSDFIKAFVARTNVLQVEARI